MEAQTSLYDERVLVLPVTRRDGEVTRTLLHTAGVECCVCESLAAMTHEMTRGVGALLLTEAALASAQMPQLTAALGTQPAWSDVPLVMLVRNQHLPIDGTRLLESLDNVTVLDRPASARSMISAVQSALRDRRKQYRIRDQLEQQAQAERALVRADQRKDEFLATLAHELRNPLAPIRNGLQILAKLRGNDPQIRRLLDIMERQMAQMVKLIDELLDVSRISTGKVVLHKQRTDMRQIIGAALEGSQPLIDAAGHRLEVQAGDEAVWVYGDPGRLAQVVGNLVNNAAKYTPNGGHIVVRMKHWDRTVEVSVEDTGVGIPPDMLASVFDMFTQVNRTLDRSQGGLGIGLALVRRLMELHGGTVHAESGGPNRGSRFSIRMPAQDAPRKAKAPLASDPHALAEKRLRVLIIDDNADAAETLSMLLESHGHETRKAFNAQAGLAAADEFMPQAVFCDIEMSGMNGYEVAARLRSNARHATAMLVAVTGRGSREDHQRSLQAGFDVHLTKPIGYEMIHKTLLRL
jgi:signal transduction histidine kinase/CheY-like chemotaxis protein